MPVFKLSLNLLGNEEWMDDKIVLSRDPSSLLEKSAPRYRHVVIFHPSSVALCSLHTAKMILHQVQVVCPTNVGAILKPGIAGSM